MSGDNDKRIGISCFIKVFSKLEYAQAFIEKGEMLFRGADFFTKIDDNNLRGDKREGTQVDYVNVDISPNVKSFFIGRNKKIKVDWEKFKKALGLNSNQNLNGAIEITYTFSGIIYCITYIDSTMTNIPEILKCIKQFGNYAVIIPDIYGFIGQIKERYPYIEMGRILYDDNAQPNLYVKKERYKDQSEFRFYIETQDTVNKYIFSGRINGIIIPVEKLETLIFPAFNG